MHYRIELSTVTKHSNGAEHRPQQLATCGFLKVQGDGYIITQMCEKLRDLREELDDGTIRETAPVGDTVSVWRGNMPIFQNMPLETAFKKNGKQPEHLKRKEK